MDFLNVFKHLLPRSTAWNLVVDKTLRQFFEGLTFPQGVKDFADRVWLDAFPQTTREIVAWEKQLGIASVELLDDWDMEAPNVDAWQIGSNAELTKTTINPYRGSRSLRVAYVDTALPYARQDGTTSGQTYRVLGQVRSDGSAIPRVLTGSDTTVFLGTNSTEWQSFDVTLVYDSPNTYLRANTTGPGYCEFDNIQFISQTRIDNLERRWKPVSGQSPKAIQDTLQAAGFDVYVYDPFQRNNLLVDGNMEAQGVDAWATNGLISKHGSNPYEGLQVIRAHTPGVYPYIRQMGLMTDTHVYVVSGVLRSDGSAIPRVRTAGNDDLFVGTISTDWQPFEVEFTSDGTDILFRADTSDGFAEFDALMIYDKADPWAYLDPNDFVVEPVAFNPLVNKIYHVAKNYTNECGWVTTSEVGGDDAECGVYDGFLDIPKIYDLPTNSDYFNHFIYISGETLYTPIDITGTSRTALEDLCLKICPTEKWIIFVEAREIPIYMWMTYGGGLPAGTIEADIAAWATSNYEKNEDVSWVTIYNYCESQWPGDFAGVSSDWNVNKNETGDPNTILVEIGIIDIATFDEDNINLQPPV